MPTTTLEAVRDNAIDIIAGLSPASVSSIGFRHSRGEMPIRDWALENPGACTRVFSITRAGAESSAGVADSAQELITVPLELVVCYEAAFGRYGTDNYRDLEDIIRQDVALINGRSGIGVHASAGYVSGCEVVRVEREEIEREGGVFFLVAQVVPTFYRAPRARLYLPGDPVTVAGSVTLGALTLSAAAEVTGGALLDTAAQMAAALGWAGSFNHYYNWRDTALPITDQVGSVDWATLAGGGNNPTYAETFPAGTGVNAGVKFTGQTNTKFLNADTGEGWEVGASGEFSAVGTIQLLGSWSGATVDLIASAASGTTRWRFQTSGNIEEFRFTIGGGIAQADFGAGTSVPAGVYCWAAQRRSGDALHLAVWRSSDGMTASGTATSANAISGTPPRITHTGSSAFPDWICGPMGVALGAQPDLTVTHVANLGAYLGY